VADRPTGREQALRDADVPAGAGSDLLARWVVERELNVHHLTEAQVLAAYKKGCLPATRR
jgi:hypothetical protein